jgi:hypothetical protein
MTVDFKSLINPETFEAMRGLVRQTFPDRKAPAPSDDLTSLVIDALPEEARAAIGIAKGVALGAEQIREMVARRLGEARGIDQADHTDLASYFIAEARHTRNGPGTHEFVAHLPMVRIELFEDRVTDFETAFGTVFAGDHKLNTVNAVRDKYAEVLAFPITRVFLTTPARYGGARFGAIATYELVDDRAETHAWILEAGMATGEAMVLYTSQHGQPIERLSWYKPTPFSAETNWYRGMTTFRPNGGGPETLVVQVSTPEERKQKQFHMEVAVRYQKLDLIPSLKIPRPPARHHSGPGPIARRCYAGSTGPAPGNRTSDRSIA